MSLPTPTPAPSAAPAAAAPVSPAAPVTPAPVAAATEPVTLNDFVELARKDLAGETTPAILPVTAGQEPSPEVTAPEPAEPTPETLEPTAEASAESDEPAAADMANWTDGEKKLHGVVKKLRQEIKELKANGKKAEAPQPAPPVEPVEPVNQPPVATTAPALADCQTFEAIDARVMQAAQAESKAVNLQNILNRNGLEPVVARLKADGVATIGVQEGQAIVQRPIDEASADEVGDFLAAVYEGSRTTQAAAPARKAWLNQNQTSLQRAVEAVPEFNDKNGPAFQAALRMVRENPLLLQKANWPEIVAKLYIGEQAIEAKLKPAPAAPAPKPAVKPAPKPAPGAPRVSAAAAPAPDRLATLKAKMAEGTATMQEVQEYGLASVRV